LEWDRSFRIGQEALREGNLESARDSLGKAAEIDPLRADLEFRLGQLHEALGNLGIARSKYGKARDLDSFRFRADKEINRRIRKVAAESKSQSVRFVDPEEHWSLDLEAIDDSVESIGIPGDQLFVDHVHFRFSASYELARRYLPDIEALLGLADGASGNVVNAEASIEEVAARLALTPYDRYSMAATVAEMTSRPPFTGQMEHASRQRARRAEVRALGHIASARTSETEELYRDALDRWPQDVLLRTNFATFFQSSGQHVAAVPLWKNLTREIPGVAAWHRQLGFALAREGQWSEAMAEMEEAQHLEGESAASHVNIGMILELQEQFEAAALRYREAIEIDPRNREANWNLALLLERDEQLQGAEELFVSMLEIHPESAQVHNRLAEFLDRQGRIEEAVEKYRRALDIRPDSAEIRNNLGVALERLNRLAEAESEYRLILQEDSTQVLAQFNLADVLLAQGRSREAIERYRMALESRPSNLQARLNLARALQSTGDWRGAESELRLTLKSRPDSVVAASQLGWVLLYADDPNVRDPQEALLHLRKADKASASSVPEVRGALAEALAENQLWEEATEIAREAAELAAGDGKSGLAADLMKMVERYGLQSSQEP
jgi:superkiller protein 3